MVTCLLCRFATELDDAAVLLAARARCICVRCFARETGDALQVPALLRREVVSCLSE
jgi:hypothetical protein